MTKRRTYDDPCGIARALDRVGERWALLVVRELLLGPRRFTDLRAGLPHASPNVLSQRLDELEASGIVQRRVLPPPAASAVYELTPWGAELEPVILSLARWGSRALPLPRGQLSSSALMLALETTFDVDAAGGLRARIGLVMNAEPYAIEVARKRLEITRGECAEPDASLIADAITLRAVVFGVEELQRARHDGRLHIAGDEAIARRFLGSFRRPTPASA